MIPSALISMVLHAYQDHAISGGHLAYKHTFDKVREKISDRRYITTSKLGAMTAMTAMSVKGENHRIVGPSYLQIAYPSIAYFNVFQ